MPDPVTRLNKALEGRYRIERELGEGGMATVYLATDLRHNRNVALKVLKPELAAVVGGERFLAEIETTANLQHANILPLFDSGQADGFFFYVMPYVDGESLRDRPEREHQLPVDEAVQLVRTVATALDHAHREGVIHRDIKPANILLRDGQPLIADFGIALAAGSAAGARMTETGLSLGAPFYISPEQATGEQHIGPASDLIVLVIATMTGAREDHTPRRGPTCQADDRTPRGFWARGSERPGRQRRPRLGYGKLLPNAEQSRREPQTDTSAKTELSGCTVLT